MDSFRLGIYLGAEFLGHRERICSPWCIRPRGDPNGTNLHTNRQCVKVPVALHPCQRLALSGVFTAVILVGVFGFNFTVVIPEDSWIWAPSRVPPDYWAPPWWIACGTMLPFVLLGCLSFPYRSVGISYRAEIQIICQICVNYLFQGASRVAQWLRIRLWWRRHRRPEFEPWVGKIPRRRAWQPTLVFLPGKSQGQWSLVGYSPWRAHAGSDTTETTEHACIFSWGVLGNRERGFGGSSGPCGWFRRTRRKESDKNCSG